MGENNQPGRIRFEGVPAIADSRWAGDVLRYHQNVLRLVSLGGWFFDIWAGANVLVRWQFRPLKPGSSRRYLIVVRPRQTKSG